MFTYLYIIIISMAQCLSVLVWPSSKVLSWETLVRICFGSPFSSKVEVCGQSCDFVPHNKLL